MMKTTLAFLLLMAGGAAACTTSAQTPQAPAEVMPRYDKSGALLLPEDYRRWVLVGSSLGLSYSPAPDSHEMFGHTLMEPTAYRSFVNTGTFREGTMLVLILQATGTNALPARRGLFGAELHGVEMAVKDKTHVSEGWAYYAFGGMNGVEKSSSAMPKSMCFSCHNEHAARDNVFMQFYPLLSEARAAK